MATFESVYQSILYSKKLNLDVEVIIILDDADPETKSIVSVLGFPAIIYETSFRDLSSARNFAVSQSSSKYISFIDADDLWGCNWLTESYIMASKSVDRKIILHPRINLYFGDGHDPYYWVHPDMRYEKLDLIDIAASNRWTSASFSEKRTYENFPYVKNEIKSGFGFEDWLWNIETFKNGYIHVTPTDTIHFIRKKSSGSLAEETLFNNSIPALFKLSI